MNDQQQQKQNDAFWTACIRAFLHDPPDKALDVKRHEERARIYLSAALNIPPAEVRDEDLKAADWLASAIERLPLPKGTLRDCDGNALDPVLEQPFNRIPRDQLRRCSPINGGDLTNEAAGLREAQDLSETVIERRAERIRLIAQANPEARLRAYALWRLLPPALPRVSQLPGDTRLTDHSIVDHADAAMAACAALQGERRASLLVFSIGPVQDFIVKGRSLRDLWTGSYFLSWLTFHAMVPILKDLGPWCITSPGLRGNPLCDWWLGEEGVRIPPDDELRSVLEREGVRWKQGGNKEEEGRLSAPLAALRCASLPNTFTALIPTARAPELAAQVREACETAWWILCNGVEGKLHACWQQLSDNDWRTGWKQQCASVWDIRCVTLPLVEVDAREKHSITASAKNMQKLYTDLCGELPEGVRAASEIARALQQQGWAPPYVTPEGQGLWMLANELAQRLLEADKRARRVPPHADTHDTREKCALFPGFSVMGPVGDTRANKDWWNTATKNRPDMPGLLRPSERLSAPGLVKRFAYGAYFEDWFAKATVGVSGSARTSHLSNFPDTREVAFGFWIKLFREQVPHGTLHWENWRKTVAGINRRTEKTRKELEQQEEEWDAWAAYELLDEGSLAAINWPHSPADEPTLRRELEKARHERAKLLRRAREAGLPDPLPYYAILVADGDRMGEVLRGTKGPTLAQAYHPEMARALRETCQVSQETLQQVRPLGMASQLAFSRALGLFTQRVQEVIADHCGTCIYAGGDDVLAVLPVATALEAAAEVAQTFRSRVPGATLSAGLAFVHCQEDLRVAIETARKAEQAAKNAGRDALAVSIVRRNGDTTTAVTGWRLIKDWEQIAKLLAGQSDRWVHHILAERETLCTLPFAAVWQRIRHHLLHGEEGERRARNIDTLFDQVRTAWESWAGNRTKDQISDDQRIMHFITWCQHAAWCSRFMPRTASTAAREASS